MLFDTGNLITLGIVVLLFILFRLLDRRNRSLARVRDYAEKCKDDISSHVEKKGEMIRNYGINLDVEKRAAEELMKRIQMVSQEELAQKVQALSQIESRIRDYDISLEELVQMTVSVQENLNRIRDESVFVEGVGQQIEEAKDRIESFDDEIALIHKNLKTIESQFERANSDALEKAIEEAMNAARSNIADMEAGAQAIEKRLEDQRDLVDKLAREREAKLVQNEEQFEKLVHDAVKRAGSRADKAEEAAMVKLREQAQERLGLIKSHFEEKVKSVQEVVKTKLGEIQEQVKSNREEWKAETSVIETRQKTYTAEWKKDVHDLNALAKEQQDNWNKNVQELKVLAKQQQDEWNKDIEELGAAVKQRQNDWNKDVQDFAVFAREQAEKLKQAVQEQQEELNAENMEQQEKFNTTLAKQREEIKAAITEHQDELDEHLKKQREEWNDEIEELTALAKEQADKLGAAIQGQKEEWETASRTIGQEIISVTHERIEEYRLAQEELFRQLAGAANDTAGLEAELRRSMQDAVNRVSGDFAQFGKEMHGNWDSASVEFNGQLRTLQEKLAGVDRDLAGIKDKAFENVSVKLKGFEDDFLEDLSRRSGDIDQQLAAWQEALDKRLGQIADDSAAKRQKAENRITEEAKKTIAIEGEKIIADLDRLRGEATAFEEGIQLEMRRIDDLGKAFHKQLESKLEELKNSAESDINSKIELYNLSTSDTLLKNQQDLEAQMRSLVSDTKERIAAQESSSEDFRKTIEDWHVQYNARMKELDANMEEARRRGHDVAEENEERVAATRSSLDEIRKEIAAQTKLFDRTDTLKVELDRHVEDISGNISRLAQFKNEITQFENQFTQIKRLAEDVNSKMTRFISEQRHIELMEKDFNRLLQTSQSVEEKLVQVSNSDDILQAMQVQIRQLGDLIKETEEKYQRIERKNKTLQETNDAIDRNFKSLQEEEQSVKRLTDTINLLTTDLDTIQNSVETLSAENEKARDAAEKLSTLDENIKYLEKRITEMNIARESLARLATELQNLDKDAQDMLNLTRSLLNREEGKNQGKSGKNAEAGAPPIRDRENIVKLRRQGWDIEAIARTFKISQAEVELILEMPLKDI